VGGLPVPAAALAGSGTGQGLMSLREGSAMPAGLPGVALWPYGSAASLGAGGLPEALALASQHLPTAAAARPRQRPRASRAVAAGCTAGDASAADGSSSSSSSSSGGGSAAQTDPVGAPLGIPVTAATTMTPPGAATPPPHQQQQQQARTAAAAAVATAATPPVAAAAAAASAAAATFIPTRSYSQHIKSDRALLAALHHPPQQYAHGMASMLDSIIKIYTVHSRPNYTLPWQNHPKRESTGTGFVVHDRLILTNAHVVADATYVLVKRHGSGTKFRAGACVGQ
jgi:S1-C subfamily serine protease